MPKGVRALLWIGILLISTHARAGARDDVRAGLTAFDALDYDRATSLMSRALAHKERLSIEERLLAQKTLGFGYVAMGRHEDAVRAFVEMLRTEPAAELDRTVSPRVRAAFDEARTRLHLPIAATPAEASRRSTATSPALAIAPSPKKPIYKKAWFWGAIAGGVVVVTTAIVLGVTLSQTTATVTVTPQ